MSHTGIHNTNAESQRNTMAEMPEPTAAREGTCEGVTGRPFSLCFCLRVYVSDTGYYFRTFRF